MTLRVEQAKAAAKRVPILGLDQLRALPGPKEYDSGIYFLWRGPALLYIGKSRNLKAREYEQHCLKRYAPFQDGPTVNQIPYDRMTCLVLEKGFESSPHLNFYMKQYERAYLIAYNPPYNFDPTLLFT